MSESYRPYPPRRRPPFAAATGHGRAPRAIALPAPVSTFRVPGGGDSSWFADDMGGVVDPDTPNPSRRDFLIRAAVAAAALTAGGAINLLASSLARPSSEVNRTGAAGSERR